MQLPPIPELVLFMALVLVLALFGLTASGHFPAEHRRGSLRAGSGVALLWGSIALCAGLGLGALAFAWQNLPLAAAIIGGGAMLLFAPILLQVFSDEFVDGPQGLVVFSAAGAALALLARLAFA